MVVIYDLMSGRILATVEGKDNYPGELSPGTGVLIVGEINTADLLGMKVELATKTLRKKIEREIEEETLQRQQAMKTFQEEHPNFKPIF